MTRHIPTDRALHGDEYRSQHRFNADAKALEKSLTLEIIRGDFPEIFAPIKNKTIGDSEINSLMDRVCEGLPGQEKRVRHNTIVAFLREGVRKYKWDVNIPAYATMAQAEKAIATPEAFSRLPDYRALERRFKQSLFEGAYTEGLNERELRHYEAGQLVFSMISAGGLHHPAWIDAATKKLSAGIFSIEGVYWFELMSDHQLRRWFPGPLTVLLIRRWYRRWGRWWPRESATALLQRFVQQVSGEIDTPLKRIGAFVSVAAMASSLESCGYIHHYQTNRNSSVSVPDTAWWRLNTKKIPSRAETSGVQPLLNIMSPTVDASELRSDISVDGLVALRKVRRALQSKWNGVRRTRKQTAAALADIAADSRSAPIVRVLSLWCRSLVTREKARGADTLALNSIRTYLSRIGARLTIALATVGDLRELEAGDWEDIYEDIIKSAKSNAHRLNRATTARKFHDFLTDHFGLPEAFIERRGTERNVDAEILTPAEFARALQLLSQQSSEPRLARIRRLVLILGFRCGLRRGEIHKLQLRDLPGLCRPELSRPELLVRPSKYGSVKSNAGIRRLPLSVLLTLSELRELRDWVKLRLSEQITNRSHELVFCDRNFSNTMLPPWLLFSPIQEAMGIASGSSLRFHHLRHSFATFTALRLLESKPGELFCEEWARDDQGNVVMPLWGGDFSALAELASADSVTGKRLWMLGQWVGHATPGETLRSYVHLTDWAAFKRSLSVEQETLTMEQQAYLLGIDSASVSVFRARHRLKGRTDANDLVCVSSSGWPAGFRTLRLSELKGYVLPTVPEMNLDELCAPRLTAMGIYHLFHKMAVLKAKGIGDEEGVLASAAHYGVAVEQAKRWHRRAMKMMNDSTDKKAVKGVSRRWSAHHQGELPTPFFERDQKKNPSATLPELAQCPAPPLPHAGQELANELFEKLLCWSQSEPEEFASALNAVENAMQRSHQQISFRSDADKKRYRRLLQQAGLCHLVTVIVKPAPDSKYNKGQIKRYWSEALDVRDSRVKLSMECAIGQRNPWGVAQLEVLPEAKLGVAARQMTMTTVRFALFAAAVAFDGDLAIDTNRLEFGDEPPVVAAG